MFEEKIQMPRMGTSVHESTILSWKKSVGDTVKKGDPILSAESDKVEFEIESTVDGVLKTIIAESDSVVPVGSILGIILTEKPTQQSAQGTEVSDELSVLPNNDETWSAPVAPLDLENEKNISTKNEEKQPKESSKNLKPNFLSPKVRKLIAQYEIDDDQLSIIAGSGFKGRITSKDILDFVQKDKTSSNLITNKTEDLHIPNKDLIDIDFTPIDTKEPKRELFEELSPTRKRISSNLMKSVTTIPQVTLFVDVDMSRIQTWRELNKKNFKSRHNLNLSYTTIISIGVISAIRMPIFRTFNAIYKESILEIKRYVNLGIATDTKDGLIVPVLRDADSLSFIELSQKIEDVTKRAKTKSLDPGETNDATITLTNFGYTGALSGNPLINPPQVSIVGTGQINPKVVLINDTEIGVRPVMSLALTFDHRINDGAIAGSFATTIKNNIERMNLKELEF
ncbi:MAG: dihydrolipoamide acetyltransferase family protein [Nitrospinota bacterium]|nr:dihydrolipoamide acetyltransferase family protein [Nitrospinota bacterium]